MQIPPVEYLFGSIFWLVLCLLGIACWLLVITPKRLSVSLQKLMFLLLSIHSAIRTFQNLFDFLEKFGFELSEETSNFVRNVNNIMDLYATYTLFMAFGFLIAFFAFQWLVHKKTLEKSFKPLLLDQKENFSKTKKGEAKFTSLLPEKPLRDAKGMTKEEIEKRKKEEDGENVVKDENGKIDAEKLLVGEHAEHAEHEDQIDELDEMMNGGASTSKYWLEDDRKRSTKTEQQKLEEYSKKSLLFVGAIYFGINFVVFMGLAIFMFSFLFFEWKSESIFFIVGRLLLRLVMTNVLIFGLILFGFLLVRVYQKKFLSIGGKLWAVIRVSIVSIIIFTIMMIANVLTTIFHDKLSADQYGVKWLWYLIMTALEMIATFFLMFTLRPVQLNMLAFVIGNYLRRIFCCVYCKQCLNRRKHRLMSTEGIVIDEIEQSSGPSSKRGKKRISKTLNSLVDAIGDETYKMETLTMFDIDQKGEVLDAKLGSGLLGFSISLDLDPLDLVNDATGNQAEILERQNLEGSLFPHEDEREYPAKENYLVVEEQSSKPGEPEGPTDAGYNASPKVAASDASNADATSASASQDVTHVDEVIPPSEPQHQQQQPEEENEDFSSKFSLEDEDALLLTDNQ